jgi:hypothetical protein
VTKRKRPTEKRRPADDAERSAVEASELLGFGSNPDRLCASDRLKVDLVSTLRLVIDHAGQVALEGGTADIGRLVGAVEQLTKLLPKAATEPASHRSDPRKALLELILTMRDRGEIADRADEPSLREEIAALRTENETLRRAARAAGAPPVTPREADVTPPSELGEFFRGPPRPGPDDPKPPVTIEGKATAAPAYDYDANSDWKSYVNSDGSIRSTPRGRWDI